MKKLNLLNLNMFTIIILIMNQQGLQQLCMLLNNGSINEEIFHLEYSRIFLQNVEQNIVRLPNGTSIGMPIIEKTIYINNTDTQRQIFPLELTNTDYIGRIISLLSPGLMIFIDFIRQSIPELGRNYVSGKDTYYYLKWLSENKHHWGIGIDHNQLTNILSYLSSNRNSHAHANELVQHYEKGVFYINSKENVEACFDTSLALLGILGQTIRNDSIIFSQRNIASLKEQYLAHQIWKKERMEKLNMTDGIQQIEASMQYIKEDNSSPRDNIYSNTKSPLRIGIENRTLKQKIIQQHTAYICSLAIYGNTLFSTSRNEYIIKAFNLSTNSYYPVLTGHAADINCLYIVGDYLYSGSNDYIIKKWHIPTMKHIANLSGHRGYINALTSSDRYLFSASDDTFIRVWDLNNNGAIGMNINGHRNKVFCLVVSGNYLFSGGGDQKILVTDTNNFFQIAAVYTEYDVYSITAKKNIIFSGHYDGTIRVWRFDEKNKNLLMLEQIFAHTTTVMSLVITNELLFSGSRDDKIGIWNVDNGKPVSNPILVNSKRINVLLANGNRLFSGSYDNTVRIWEP